MNKFLAPILALGLVLTACQSNDTGPQAPTEVEAYVEAFCFLDVEVIAAQSDPRYMQDAVNGMIEASEEGVEWCSEFTYLGNTQNPAAAETHTDFIFAMETTKGYFWYVFTQDNETKLIVHIQ